MQTFEQPAPAGVPQRPASGAVFWGMVLIAAGLFFLAVTFGFVPNPTGAVVGVAFVMIGLVLLAAHVALHVHWWTLIAGPTLVGLGAVILLPGGGNGSLFLGGIGLGFLLVAVTNRAMWWAVIPAGTMLTLALVALLSNAIGGFASGAVLFFGLAATFGVLALIKVNGTVMRWPLFPALGCLLMGLVIVTSGPASRVFWPAVLIVLGLFLLIRATAKRA